MCDRVWLIQVVRDYPQITKIYDKSDNAGCYHTETLFSWKMHWMGEIGVEMVETIFSEAQDGKNSYQ